jgi:hypothetical protein
MNVMQTILSAHIRLQAGLPASPIFLNPMPLVAAS